MLTVNICSHMKGKFIFLENLNNLNPAGFVFDILKGNKKIILLSQQILAFEPIALL